jgi:hypothetical protein
MTVKEPQFEFEMIHPRSNEPTESDELSITLWQAYRKFANKNIEKIAEMLYANGPLKFAELAGKTGQSRNVLNHNLIEMRHTDLVILKDEKYHITKYGALLYESSNRIKDTLKQFNKNEMLEVFYENNRQ